MTLLGIPSPLLELFGSSHTPLYRESDAHCVLRMELDTDNTIVTKNTTSDHHNRSHIDHHCTHTLTHHITPLVPVSLLK